MKSIAVASAVVAITLITFFQFPGHTWLQQDSQIYVPILEHLRDSSVLRNDVLVQRPHVSFTLYDEAALWLHGATGLGFREVLGAEQIATRALGIWGLYLMAAAAGLATGSALFAAAAVSLGATIVGPSVLTFEYEPIPRGFAVPLQICAVGLLAHGRYLGAGVAATIAFLIHPPTVYPFWGVYFLLALWPGKPEQMKRRLWGLMCLMIGVVVLWIASRLQAGAVESQVFFSRLTQLQEGLQRMRASYVWVSLWGPSLWTHYAAICVLLAAAYVRIRPRLPFDLRIFVLGLPVVGIASMPLSWILLERTRWALIPQFQPMRALLFVALMFQFATVVAAILAAEKRRYAEAFGWFAAAYLIPLIPRVNVVPAQRQVLALLLLAAVATAAMWIASRGGGARWAMAVPALAAFWVVPGLGGVVNYPRLHTPVLRELAAWARASTPRDSVFLFPDAGRGLDPGIFRANSLRAVYVDWKGGGQVNYLKELGEQWWFRWQQVGSGRYRPMEPAKYGALGIHYIVLHPKNRLPDRPPVYENARYVVYPVP